MAIEVFTQLVANGDQLEQQYRLRERFCVGLLGWQGRTVYEGMEYDQYDTPATVYIVWRDNEDIARAMCRFTPCTLPYMIADHWPHLVGDRPLPSGPTQWELTRFCVERELGASIPEAIYQICAAAERLAEHVGIDEYWWISPKERLEQILPHNNHVVGDGMQIEHEFCHAGFSKAREMVNPSVRLRRIQRQLEAADAPLPHIPGIAA